MVKDGRMVDGMAEKGIEKSAAESATFMALYIKVLWGEREESTNHAGWKAHQLTATADNFKPVSSIS